MNIETPQLRRNPLLTASNIVWSLILGGLAFVLILALVQRVVPETFSVLVNNSSSRGGSSSLIEDVAWLPDSKAIVLGLDDKTELYSVPGGDILRTLPTRRVAALAMSANGKVLATADNGAVRLWNLESGVLLRIISTTMEFQPHLSFSHDGEFLAIGYEYRVEVRSTQDGSIIRTIHSPALTINFSPDGKYVALGEVTVTLWRVSDGKLLRTLPGWKYATFSPDSKMIATVSSDDDATVLLYTLEEGTLLNSLTGQSHSASGDPLTQTDGLTFSTDGHYLVQTITAQPNSVVLWRVSDGKMLGSHQIPSSESILGSWFSPNGKYVITWNRHAVYLWRWQEELH